VAKPLAHVANEPPALSAGSPGQAPSEEDDGIIVPCRDLNGRIIWVSVPRRTFLLGGVSAAAGVVAGAASSSKPAQALARLGGPAADAAPVEHLRNLRAVLVESDNLLGPRHVVPTVEGTSG
jgi:hypothetical protein